MSLQSASIGHRAFAVICILGLFFFALPATAQDTDSVGDLVSELVGTLAPPNEEPDASVGVKRGVCESKDHKRNYCRVDTSGGVRLVKQLSRASCDDAWGYDANGIWVDNGCRAEFEVGAPTVEPTPAPTPAPTPDTEPTAAREKILCESTTGHRVRCPADTSAGVELLRTLSSNPCLGHWGYDSTGIWVNGGCRGEFSVVKSEIAPTPVPMPKLKTVKCKSVNGRQAFCSADTSKGVRLLRKLGRSACEDNWGFDTNGIWVANNCHGEFELGEPTVTGPSLVVCRATTSAKQYCSARVTTSIRLVRQLSRAKCFRNWGFDENGIWVRNGCQAEFEVE